MTPYFTDATVQLHHGDAATVLASLPAESVDCIVTSPPYYALRDYGVERQIGAEETPKAYVKALVGVFRAAWRVLADHGVLWLNLDDRYAAAAGQGTGGSRPSGRRDRVAVPAARMSQSDRPAKSLLGLPWRVALALQDDGWILRNDIIWHKTNAIPESVTDRLSNRHEHLFMLVKNQSYHFDLDPIRDARLSSAPPLEQSKYVGSELRGQRHGGNQTSMHRTGQYQSSGRNTGDVWTIGTTPFPGAHFAAMPPALAERCILSGCKPGGVVLDPFIMCNLGVSRDMELAA